MALEIDIEKIKSDIAIAPKKPKKTLQTKSDVIDSLRPHLLTMKKKGYDFKEIAEFLKDHGFEISVSTLKNYLSKKKPVVNDKPKSLPVKKDV